MAHPGQFLLGIACCAATSALAIVIHSEQPVLSWEDKIASQGVTLHRKDGALMSGQLMFGILGDVIEKVKREAIDLVLHHDTLVMETELLEDDDNSSWFDSRGLYFTMSRTVVSEGTYLITEASNGCRQHEIFGDNDCAYRWGTSLNFNGALHIGKKIEKGSRVAIQAVTRMEGTLAGLLQIPDVSLDCAACGEDCEYDLFEDRYSFKMPDCPIEPSEFSFMQLAMTLPRHKLMHIVNPDVNLIMVMRNANGSVITNPTIHVAGGSIDPSYYS